MSKYTVTNPVISPTCGDNLIRNMVDKVSYAADNRAMPRE